MFSQRIVNLEKRINLLNSNLKELEAFIYTKQFRKKQMLSDSNSVKSRFNSFMHKINNMECRLESLINSFK